MAKSGTPTALQLRIENIRSGQFFAFASTAALWTSASLTGGQISAPGVALICLLVLLNVWALSLAVSATSPSKN